MKEYFHVIAHAEIALVLANCGSLKMTLCKYLCRILSVIAVTTQPVTCHPHVSHVSQQETSQLGQKCFNSFDNFDECWEKIEEFCLNEVTGEFENCDGNEHTEEEDNHQHDTGNDSSDHEDILDYEYSKHCYSRYRNTNSLRQLWFLQFVYKCFVLF